MSIAGEQQDSFQQSIVRVYEHCFHVRISNFANFTTAILDMVRRELR